MSPSQHSDNGFTLLELLVTLTIMGILLGLAVPAFLPALETIRARRGLDRVVVELYRARMMAVESGGGVSLILRRDPDGCVRRLQLTSNSGGPDSIPPSEMPLDLAELCLRHTGDSIVSFNGRGLLRPPTRSFFITHGSSTDSALVSIAGRVRRTYRRKRRIPQRCVEQPSPGTPFPSADSRGSFT